MGEQIKSKTSFEWKCISIRRRWDLDEGYNVWENSFTRKTGVT
jgi:hypothetical protein